MQHKIDVPLEKIMKEVALSTAQGSDHITLITEDLFLYGAKDPKFVPNREAVVKLLKQSQTIQASKAFRLHICLWLLFGMILR